MPTRQDIIDQEKKKNLDKPKLKAEPPKPEAPKAPDAPPPPEPPKEEAKHTHG